MNQTELKNKIIEETQTWFILGCDELGIDWRDYTLDVEFFSRGCVGGSAIFRRSTNTGTLKFNIILVADNLDEYINQVIPHEVAHIIKSIKYGDTIKGYTRKGKRIHDRHGSDWQYIMRKMGKNPDRCHKMDVSKVKQKRTVKRWVYECPTCRKQFGLTSQKHNKAMVKNPYICNVCHDTSQRLCFTGEIREYAN